MMQWGFGVKLYPQPIDALKSAKGPSSMQLPGGGAVVFSGGPGGLGTVPVE